MCKVFFCVPIRKLSWTEWLNIRGYDWLVNVMAYGCLVHYSANLLSLEVLILIEVWNGHFREWWDGNVFSWDLLTSMVFRWFYKTLAITIKCFFYWPATGFDGFAGPWPSPSNVCWHAFLPTKISILGGAWWSYMRLIPRFRVFGEFNYVPKPTKFYITTLVAFCFREEALSWVFVDYPGKAGVESKLSGDKKLFLFLPPAPQPVVRIQRWGGIYHQVSYSLNKVAIFPARMFSVWLVSKYLNIYTSLSNCLEVLKKE